MRGEVGGEGGILLRRTVLKVGSKGLLRKKGGGDC